MPIDRSFKKRPFRIENDYLSHKGPMSKSRNVKGPSQRQLKAGELVRHALVEILRQEPLYDQDLENLSVTVTEVRVSPDMRHAIVFIEPLGGKEADRIVKALNRFGRYIRGKLGQSIALKFTPELRFRHDKTFETARAIDELFENPEVKRDLAPKTDRS